MRTPKISVILPVYNGEKYLIESIDSVLRQEFGDYELLICDDGSTDDSVKIIESKQDPRIKFFKNDYNQGEFRTFNILIRQSKGEYISLWAQDDIMKSYCLGEEIEFYEKHPEIGFCYCAYDIIDVSGKIVMKAPEDQTPDVISPKLAAQIMFYYGSITGNVANGMIKKSVLDKMGFFREDIKQSGDFEMWVRISEKYPIGFIRHPLIKLRSHSGQISRKKGTGLTCMREDKEIFTVLIERLPPDIRSYAKTYNRWHRHTQYVHYMFRSLLAGDLKTAVGAYQQICDTDNPFLAIILWFITANNHFFKKKPKFL